MVTSICERKASSCPTFDTIRWCFWEYLAFQWLPGYLYWLLEALRAPTFAWGWIWFEKSQGLEFGNKNVLNILIWCWLKQYCDVDYDEYADHLSKYCYGKHKHQVDPRHLKRKSWSKPDKWQKMILIIQMFVLFVYWPGRRT